MQDIDEFRQERRRDSYHWKQRGGRLGKYHKAQERGGVRIPIDGNIYRILRAIKDGQVKMSSMQGSCFSGWDAEQVLVYGLVSHTLGNKMDYKLTEFGEQALIDIEHARTNYQVRPVTYYPDPRTYDPHINDYKERIKPIDKRLGPTIFVTVQVSEFWFEHFHRKAW